MDKECMVKEDLHLQDITEWIEEATVEWVIWEWVAPILICHSNNNMAELQILANMVHIQEWAQEKVIKVVHQIQWTHVEAMINLKMVVHLNIIHQAMAKEAQVTWVDTVNHHNSIHLRISLVVKPEETFLLLQTLIKTQWIITHLIACLNLFNH